MGRGCQPWRTAPQGLLRESVLVERFLGGTRTSSRRAICPWFIGSDWVLPARRMPVPSVTRTPGPSPTSLAGSRRRTSERYQADLGVQSPEASSSQRCSRRAALGDRGRVAVTDSGGRCRRVASRALAVSRTNCSPPGPHAPPPPARLVFSTLISVDLVDGWAMGDAAGLVPAPLMLHVSSA
jgi:hypothetical protein